MDCLMNFNEQVMKILSDPSFDNFTPFELKKAIKGKNGGNYLEDIIETKFICAQIKLLVRSGVIKRSDKENSFRCTYEKTFNYHPKRNTQVDSSSIGLKEKYFSYKQQLLVGIGEAEEYKKLCLEYPELQKDLQPKYNNIREQNTKILGKIKVIESLVNNKST
tara:strand:- start:2471 stop:2959 length:489 start_codon:yes stop_codon:yes gene_type:complete